MPIFRKFAYMPKNELKVCSGSYDNGNKEFSGTYINGYVNGKHQQYRVGVWKFWYSNGKIKIKGLYKDGTSILKKCWNFKRESITCGFLVILGFEKLRILKDQ